MNVEPILQVAEITDTNISILNICQYWYMENQQSVY